MKSENEYVALIRKRLTTNDSELLQLVDRAVGIFPFSAELLLLRYQAWASAVSPAAPPEHAVDSLRLAIEQNPVCSEALEAMGAFYDVWKGDLAEAEKYLEMAVLHHGSAHAFAGLARVKAERGHRQEAISLLRRCVHQNDPVVIARLHELIQGDWGPIGDDNQ